MIYEDVCIIVSNLAIFVSVYFAYKEQRWIPCVFLFFAGITSFIYHFLWSIPVHNHYENIRWYFTFLDFYHETLALIALSISAIPISKYNQFLLFLFYYFLFLFLVLFSSIFASIDEGFELFGFTIGCKVAIICFLFIMLMVHIIGYYFYLFVTGKKVLVSYYPLSISVLLFLVSISFFYMAYLYYYWIFHSLWHICIMACTFFVLKIKEKPSQPQHTRTNSNVF